MLVFGIKHKFGYSEIKKDKNDLKRYLKNTLFPVVKLETIDDPKGKYLCFKNKDVIIIQDNPIIFDLCIKDLEGKTTTIRLEEI